MAILFNTSREGKLQQKMSFLLPRCFLTKDEGL